MGHNVQLKPIQVGMTIFTSLLIGAMIIGRIFFGPDGFYWAFSGAQILLAIIHLTVLLRTRNWIYLIPFGMYSFWFLTFFPPLAQHPWHLIFSIISALFLFAFIGLLFSRRLEWRYKEILQRAARPVSGTADGFTPRPFPTGSAEFTRQDVLGLAAYLKKNVISFPFMEKDRVVLVIPEYMWTYMLYLKRNYDSGTYVAFSDTGQVTVRIAKSDYGKYREELTFDELCASLGDLFKQFMAWYREGNREKIFELLKTTGKGGQDGN